MVLWFTGLSGAGKSTIANLIEKTLAARQISRQLDELGSADWPSLGT